MRRVTYHSHGGPEVLVHESAPDPTPGPGELLIRVEAIGVTLPSVRATRDPATPLPGVLGGEVAGPVVAVGPGVDDFAPGDRVTSLTFSGSYTDLAVAPAMMASRIPPGATAVQAVSLVRSGHVALAALHTAALRPDESVLITGAASGVGHLLVQLSRSRRVVAAVGSPEKVDFVRSLGAHEAVTYAELPGLAGKVDVVLDAVGGDLLPAFVGALAPGGRLVFFNSGGGTVPAYELLAGAKTITGMTMRQFAATHRARYDEHEATLWRLLEAGELRPVVHAEFPLAEATAAHAVIEARANLGKVVLRPAP
ncbi:quinone oxidoreductase family protein [Nucisporomicrobium flavum]|jgi:NADPH:quinone reductase|uniref:quinone oxidoreductase family protein n=1 Tax=Nucisporomicrobium flavum TaxID=2785915 RepID=UPI0018F27E6E|nr:zinc-binding dehydrogenase [Nucisporomicrobium flavum]